MRKICAVVVAVVLAVPALAQPLPAPQHIQPVKAEVPVAAKASVALDGVWLPTSCEYLGQQEMDDKLKEALRLSIENGQHKLYFLTDPVKMEGKRLSTAALQLNEKAGSFELDISEGQRKGGKLHGIYEITDDTLKLCYGSADKPRPTKFESTKEQPGVFNEVWTRYKKKK